MKILTSFTIGTILAAISGAFFFGALLLTREEQMAVRDRVIDLGLGYPVSAIIVIGLLVLFISFVTVSLPARNTRRIYND